MRKVVIIDDDLDDIELLREAISLLGHQFSCVSYLDTRKALSYLKESNESPDYLIIDIYMPVMSGDILITEIKKLAKLHKAKIIAQSSTIPAQNTLDFLAANNISFFEKPSSFDDLCKQIATHLN